MSELNRHSAALTAGSLTGENEETTLATELGVTPALARVLIARGFDTPASARKFLNSRLDDLHAPSALPDMERAVELIRTAIRSRRKVLIWGHEDLDGISSVVCLYRTLSSLGADVSYWIPPKGTEPHGLQPVRAREILGQDRALIVTVDCGVTNFREVTELQKEGITVIITDHHEVLDSLPAADAVIDPKRPDSRYPFERLAGVGVALKLAQAVAEKQLQVTVGEFFSALPELFTLTALGTIADRVPLIDENRILVRIGLEQLSRNRLPALNAVFEACGIPTAHLTVQRIVSDLMPLFASAEGNAGVRMILNGDLEASRVWVQGLIASYQAWRDEAHSTLLEAEQRIELSPGILFVCSDRLSLRALGHCAARLKEDYLLPVIVMGKRNDHWVGECRGVEGVNLVELLKANAALLRSYGGHAKACGFTIASENLEVFVTQARRYAAEHFDGRIVETRDVIPEAVVALSAIGDEFRKLAPFGEGNPLPRLFAPGTRLELRAGQLFCPDAPTLVIQSGTPVSPLPGRFELVYQLDEMLQVEILQASAAAECNGE